MGYLMSYLMYPDVFAKFAAEGGFHSRAEILSRRVPLSLIHI